MLLVTCYLLLVTCYLLLVTCYLLLERLYVRGLPSMAVFDASPWRYESLLKALKVTKSAFTQILSPAGAFGILRITSATGRANAHPCAAALYAAIHGAPTRGSGNSQN